MRQPVTETTKLSTEIRNLLVNSDYHLAGMSWRSICRLMRELGQDSTQFLVLKELLVPMNLLTLTIIS